MYIIKIYFTAHYLGIINKIIMLKLCICVLIDSRWNIALQYFLIELEQLDILRLTVMLDWKNIFCSQVLNPVLEIEIPNEKLILNNIVKTKTVWIYLGNNNVYKYYPITYYNIIILVVFSYIFYASVNHVFFRGEAKRQLLRHLYNYNKFLLYTIKRKGVRVMIDMYVIITSKTIQIHLHRSNIAQRKVYFNVTENHWNISTWVVHIL